MKEKPKQTELEKAWERLKRYGTRSDLQKVLKLRGQRR